MRSGFCHTAKTDVNMFTWHLAVGRGPEGLFVKGVLPGPINETGGMAGSARTQERRVSASLNTHG